MHLSVSSDASTQIVDTHVFQATCIVPADPVVDDSRFEIPDQDYWPPLHHLCPPTMSTNYACEMGASLLRRMGHAFGPTILGEPALGGPFFTRRATHGTSRRAFAATGRRHTALSCAPSLTLPPPPLRQRSCTSIAKVSWILALRWRREYRY